MISAGGIDGVVVATPPSEQAKIALAAMQQRLPILLEKPISLAVETANQLTEMADSTGAIVHVDHTDLFNPALRALRDRIASSSEIISLRGAWSNQGPVRSDVRGLWDYGAHAVAVALDLMGTEPEAITAIWVNHVGDKELVEVGFRWGDVTANLTIGNGDAERNRWLEITTGSHRLHYNDIADRKATIDGRAIDYAGPLPLTTVVERFVAAIKRAKPDTDDLLLGAACVRTLAAIQDILETSS